MKRISFCYSLMLSVFIFLMGVNFNGIALAQNGKKVVGKVQDESEVPLPGVNVTIKGTDVGVVTGFDGEFEIELKEKSTVVFSYVGFESQEISYEGEDELKITLKENVDALDEVVIVGYGTQKKANLTGAVSQINADVLENRPVTGVGQALQGAIPNLNINFAGNGNPNSNPSYNIRGGTSFSEGSFSSGSPLVLVDGIESDINLLNPDDIESVTVLKDAASAAIYGARAAFGVVLVTTKKGKKGDRTSIQYTHSTQFSKPSHIPDLMDAYTIQENEIKALELENRTPSSDMLERLDMIEKYMSDPMNNQPYYVTPGGEIKWIANVNPYEEAIRSYAPTSKHNLSVNGGNETNTYYASIGIQDQKGLYKINNDQLQRYNLMLNMDTKVGDWFSLSYGVQYNHKSYEEPVSASGKGGWWTAMSQEPSRNVNMPVKTPESSPVGEMYTDNILSFMDYGSSQKENTDLLLLKIGPEINIVDNWKIKGDFSYKSNHFRRKTILPELERIENRWESPTTVHTNPSYISRDATHSNQFTLNLFTDYTLNVKKHEIYGLVGYNQEWYKYESLYGRGEDILSPNIPVISQTLGNEYTTDSESHWAIRGVFYRIKYNFDDRFLLESNGRYDGTSRFPKDTRFSFFPSISGAWRVSEEKFASFLKPGFDELKFRVSYGALGNQNVANYIYVPSYGTTSQISYMLNGYRPLGVTPPGIVDADLTWETATTIDFGVDITMFKKLDLSFDWYERKTTDILIAGDKLPAVLGTSAPTKNSGAMTTKGWEFTLNWRDQLKNGFRYDIAFNLSNYESKITSFDGNPNKLLSSLYVGQKMGEIWGYETDGIFQSEDEIANAPDHRLINSNIYPGDIRYKDLNGDGEISPGASTVDDPGDRRIIGNSTPKFQYGLNMNAFWKDFDLNLFFQGVGKRDYWIGGSYYWGSVVNGNAIGTFGEVYNDSWTPENTNAFFPAYKTKGSNASTQTRYLQNAAYLRLKNVSLGYSLPGSVVDKLGIAKLRFSLSGYNIWELTSLPDGLDPEAMSPNYPMMRTYAIGVQATF